MRAELREFLAHTLGRFDGFGGVVRPSDVRARSLDVLQSFVGELGQVLAPLAEFVEDVVVAEVIAVRAGPVAVAVVKVPRVVSSGRPLLGLDLGVHRHGRVRGLDDGRAVA